jgi:hypothetical protein
MSRRQTRRAVIYGVVTVTACVACAALSAQQRERLPIVSSFGSTRVISPTVQVTWATERAADGVEQLRLLVLWRGTPGWFVTGGGTHSSSSSTGASIVTITRGDVQLHLEYDSSTRIAVFNDRRIDTRETNVLFVDHVDAPTGAQLVGTTHIGPAMPGSGIQLGPMFQMSPEVMTFLQCDATSSDASKQRVIENLCLQTIGVAR